MFKKLFENWKRIKAQKIINSIILEIRTKYPNLVVGYNFDADNNLHEIWHNSEYLEFEDDEFSEFVGSLISEKLFNNKICNIFFGYDYHRAKIEMEGK